VACASTGTITTRNICDDLFDARMNAGPFTVTDGRMYGGKFLDPNRRSVVGGDFYTYFDPSPSLVFGVSVANPLSLSP
jgi:hypothetical protein